MFRNVTVIYCIFIGFLCFIIVLIVVAFLLLINPLYCLSLFFFFFKLKTAYELRISDWSSDVCSSDLTSGRRARALSGRSWRCARRSRRALAAQWDRLPDRHFRAGATRGTGGSYQHALRQCRDRRHAGALRRPPSAHAPPLRRDRSSTGAGGDRSWPPARPPSRKEAGEG